MFRGSKFFLLCRLALAGRDAFCNWAMPGGITEIHCSARALD